MFTSHSSSLWLTKSKVQHSQEDEKYSFKKELYLFLNNTICHCYRHLAQVDRSVTERTMWTIINMIGAGSLLFFTITAWNSFATNPLVTTLHDTIYPIRNIPFPAVSVCSNNRISRTEAIKYAKELSKIDPEDRPDDYYLKQLLYMGRIYDFETENEHLVTAFQQFLDQSAGNTSAFSFENTIKRLTPKCDDLLIKCFFKSQEFECMSDYKMIEERRTQHGYCCSFNYIRRDDENPL